MVAISFEASIDDRSSSSSSGVHKKLRGTLIPLRLQPQFDKTAYGSRFRYFHSFWPGGITAVARSDKDCGSVAVVVPLSSGATQSPAHSFVLRTVPTSLQPIGSFGFTRTTGLLPTLGGAPWANAVAEKQIATRMSSDLIVNLPFAPTSGGWSQKISRRAFALCGRAEFLKIDAYSISRQHYREMAAHYRNLPVEFQDISPRPARVLAHWRQTNEAVSNCYGCERFSQQRPVADDQKLPHDPAKSPTKSRCLRAAPHE